MSYDDAVSLYGIRAIGRQGVSFAIKDGEGDIWCEHGVTLWVNCDKCDAADALGAASRHEHLRALGAMDEEDGLA